MHKYKKINKLVRDKIPEIIKKNDKEPMVKKLSGKEYKIELYKKLLEKANEVIESKNFESAIEELADVLEVLKSIAQLNKKDLNNIIEVADQKRIKRGGFEKRLFLEKTYIKENKG